MEKDTRECLRKAPDKIVAQAEHLLSLMKGDGWKLRIWENLGYHYAVYNGTLTVHTHHGGNPPYFCLLNLDEINGGGEVFWTGDVGESFADPNEAVRQQLKVVREFAYKVGAVCRHLERIVST